MIVADLNHFGQFLTQLISCDPRNNIKTSMSTFHGFTSLLIYFLEYSNKLTFTHAEEKGQRNNVGKISSRKLYKNKNV